MKRYKDLYEEEKQRHEETLQRYQVDHMDKMEIINLHKKCNKKARKVSQPKQASVSDEPKKTLSKSDEPKKVSGFIDDSSEAKKISSDGKKTARKAGKKVEKTSRHKKAPKSPEFIDSSEENEEGLSQDDKEKKMSPLLGVKKEIQSFFDLQKDSKNLTIEKKVEKTVFMAEPCKGYVILRYITLHYVIFYVILKG